MKKGSGDDPFASDDEEDEERSTDIDDRADLDSATAAVVRSPAAENQSVSTPDPQSADSLPYLARRQLRNKSVKANRDQIPFEPDF